MSGVLTPSLKSFILFVEHPACAEVVDAELPLHLDPAQEQFRNNDRPNLLHKIHHQVNDGDVTPAFDLG